MQVHSLLASPARYFHSVRHLKPVQVYWRGWLALARLRPFNARLGEAPVFRAPVLVEPVAKHQSWHRGTFRFLNHVARFDGGIDWNRADLSKLWLYNLHYFDWVNQPAVDPDAALALMTRWAVENPPGVGSGWEPYPLSLRIVNWLKFFADHAKTGQAVPDGLTESLYLQARYLARHLEYHLLGNHLFKNGVALLFAGACCEGPEAERWYHCGREILLEQLAEQILPDGGHFERSVMYHAITLEDVLDCLNLLRSTGPGDDVLAVRLADSAWAMRQFLADVLHPDGEIPLFNDAAFGIAPKPVDLFAYAARLGLGDVQTARGALVAKPDFGLWVLRHRGATLLVDAGAIGPDYLPGHAHCDTLSFELSLGSDRWFVNAGTFTYTGEDRARYRGTAAHNTLTIDGAEQHEIWASFRVARRGYPERVELLDDGGIRAAHGGYRRLPGSPVHERELRLLDHGIEVRDTVKGRGRHTAASFLHLHPDVAVERAGPRAVVCRLAARQLRVLVDGDEAEVLPYDYAPEFGLKRPAQCLVGHRSGIAPFTLGMRFEF